jgi:hypothetical protein
MTIWQWLINWLTASTVWTILVKGLRWIWNQHPAAKELKRTKKINRLNDELYAELTYRLSHIEEVCIEETLQTLQDMRITSEQATNDVIDSLRQRLERHIRSMNKQTGDDIERYNKAVATHSLLG